MGRVGGRFRPVAITDSGIDAPGSDAEAALGLATLGCAPHHQVNDSNPVWFFGSTDQFAV